MFREKNIIRKTKEKMRRYFKEKKGAVVIEATLSLTFFMFLIVTLLSLVNICTAQAKIGVALNQTAEEISQYTYLYNLSGVGDLQAQNYEKTEEARHSITEVVDSVSSSAEAIKKFGAQEASFDDTWEQVKTDTGKIDGVYRKIADSKDKSQWVFGLIRILGNEGYEAIKGALGGEIAKGLMCKHLMESEDTDVDAYLKHLGIKNGLDGLRLSNSSILTNGTDDITLICKYDIHALNFFNHEYTFHFTQVAKTKAWSAKSIVEEISTEEETETSTGDTSEQDAAIRQKMVEKYGEEAIKEIEAAYNTKGWTEQDWEYYILQYANSDPSGNKTGKELEDYLATEYGQESIDMINEWVDTTGWTYQDWIDFIDAYTTPGEDGCLKMGGCFEADTPVQTINGPVAIQDIQSGDYVLSYNQAEGEDEYQKVLNTYSLHSNRITVVVTREGDAITTTRTHLFYTENKGFVPAGNLKTGDVLRQPDGKLTEVQMVDNTSEDEWITVYNFEVEKNQNYYVGQDKVLVHNSCVAYQNLTNTNPYRVSTVTYKYKNGHSASELTNCNQAKGGNVGDTKFVGRLRGEDVTLDNVEVKKVTFTKQTDEHREKLRKAFDSSVRKEFLKNLGSDTEKLKKAGFSEDDIALIQNGFVPEGWQVHHVIPLDGGGTNDFSNLVLIKNEPYHKTVTNYHQEVKKGLQSGDSVDVNWPMFPDNIYPTTQK